MEPRLSLRYAFQPVAGRTVLNTAGAVAAPRRPGARPAFRAVASPSPERRSPFRMAQAPCLANGPDLRGDHWKPVLALP